MSVRAIAVINDAGTPSGSINLDAQARHIRRRLLVTGQGEDILVDLEKPVHLREGDGLLLEDGRVIAIHAAAEGLLEVRARDAVHHAQLAWHIGNRHLEAQIEAERILIRPDHVIEKMLQQQGATIRHVTEPFSPEPGAYSHAHAAEPKGTYDYAP
jgi:urease accessory protein